MSEEEKRFDLWVNKFRNELVEGQIEVLQDSLSNFEWPDEYKEKIQFWIEELNQNKDELFINWDNDGSMSFGDNENYKNYLDE